MILSELETYHLVQVRKMWTKNGMKENCSLHIPKKYKLEVRDDYFLYFEFWHKVEKKWIHVSMAK